MTVKGESLTKTMCDANLIMSQNGFEGILALFQKELSGREVHRVTGKSVTE